MLTLAPFRIDSSPDPASPIDSEPVVTSEALLPLIDTSPAPLVCTPASSVAALTVPPAVMFSDPSAASPTSSELVINSNRFGEYVP